MKITHSLNEIDDFSESVCTIGSFDGIHRAHREIINETKELAARSGLRTVVITFDPHPKDIVKSSKGPIELLTTINERINLLQELKIDILFILKFTFEFSRMSSRDFYKRFIVEGLNAKKVVVGYDHMFGRDRESGVKELTEFGTMFGFRVHIIPPLRVAGKVVNSSKIRDLLIKGDVESAALFLSRRYSITGKVIHGDGRGAGIGFPTANIKPNHSRKLIPGNGVYFVTGVIGGKRVPGMMNIGVRPTFKTNGERNLEIHFLENVGEIYGEEMEVEFVKRVRDEVKFRSEDELIKRLKKDKEECLKLVDAFDGNK